MSGLRFRRFHVWLLVAALCQMALPAALFAQQARDGSLLQVVCTAQGMKALGGQAAGAHHDCADCCVGSAPPVPASTEWVRADRTDGISIPAAPVTPALREARYLAPPAHAPPSLS
jgi:hypothetical protein